MRVLLLKMMMATILLLTACNGQSTDSGQHNKQVDDEKAQETTGKVQDETGVNLAAEFLNDIKVENGVNYIQNPNNILVLVNKENSLPVDYKADDLVVPDVLFSFSGEHEKKLMRKEAAEALEKMFAAAKDEGIELAAVSGFRSYSRQEVIYQSEIEVAGLEHAQQAVAEPGKSEHQTGLTMDVSSPENNFQLNKAFGSTKAGLWLADNSWEYGFIIRYPEGAEKITGYMYEPWHIRYVGKEYATDIKKRGLTLEEYIQLATE